MIADTFIRRPVTAIVASIVILLVGTLAILNLPISQYPEITPPTVQVQANYTGADAQTVEQNVTTPIETQVNGTPGMDYIQSTSTNDGRSAITVALKIGTNPDIAALDIQNRVSIATPQLPSDVTRLGVVTRKRNPSILMLVAMYSPNGSHGVSFVDNYTNIYIQDALKRVPGVGDIFTRADDFSMRVWLNPDKLAQFGMTANDIVLALQEQNVQISAGSVGSSPQLASQAFEYSVTTDSRLNTEDQFRNVIVRTNPETGALVYLKDVARVQLGKFSYNSNSFVDKKRASYLLIFQQPGSNALDVAKGITDQMEELKKSFPNDIDYIVPFESVTVVRVSIEEVVKTLVIALVLVTIVVYLFLQNLRATLIPVLAIPVSIIGTFAFFIPLGFTINTLTMFGFVLAIGIVVDDAIVVVEAVQNLIDTENLSAKEATHKAMEEISAPVIAIALILAAVFVPAGFIPGIIGRLYQQFAITIAISVLISAFVALSLTPALCSLLLKKTPEKQNAKGLNKFFIAFNKWFDRVTLRYTVTVRKIIGGAKYVVVFLVLIFVAIFFLFRSKPTGFVPAEDEGRLIMTYELPEASSTSRSLQVLDSMMNILKGTKGILHFAALGGYNGITGAAKTNSGTLFCQLQPWNDRKGDSLIASGIQASLQKKFASIKGANIIVVSPPSIPGLGQTGGFTFELQARQSTDSLPQFQKAIQGFLAAANQRPEMAGVFTFFTANTPNYAVSVDREKCKKLGVSLTDVYNTMQTMMGSRYINDFTVYGRTFRVLAQADTAFRSDINDLSQYYVRNSSGTLLPLSTVVSYHLAESAPLITHFNLFRTAEINGSAKPGYSSGDAITALQEVAAKTLPEGYSFDWGGLSRQEVQSGNKSSLIFVLSTLFVFLFLAALYESWAVPFSVLLAVPLGVFGAILTLTLLPKLSNNVYAQIGLITLIGLAAKNAILIVEFAKERVDNGMALLPATLQAVKLRLRPIIMTSLAFILGVLPLAFATGASGVARSTIGWTVLGGMLAATTLGIFVVPALFMLISKVSYSKRKLEELQLKTLEAEQGIPYDMPPDDKKKK